MIRGHDGEEVAAATLTSWLQEAKRIQQQTKAALALFSAAAA